RVYVDNIEMTYGTKAVEEPVVEVVQEVAEKVVEEEPIETVTNTVAAAVNKVIVNEDVSNNGLTPAELDAARTKAEAAIAQIQSQIIALNAQISATGTEIADLNARLEAGRQEPDCAFGAGRYSTTISAEYHGLPAGMQMQILDSRGGVAASDYLTEGEGNQNLGIPNVGTDLYMTVQLVRSDSSVVSESITELSVFRNNAHRGLNSGWMKMTSLSSPWNPEELIATRDALITQLSTLESDRDALEAQLPAAEATLKDSQEELQEVIPYSRMRVEGFSGTHNNEINVRYATEFDSVTFRLYAGTNVVNIPMTHAGGEQDKTFSHRIPTDLIGNYTNDSNTVFTFDMLGPDGQVLDRAMVNSKGRILTEQDEWEKLEAGRMVENPIEPSIKVAAISGPTVLFTVASCHDISQVYIDGGGMMSGTTLEHEGGTELSMGKVTINASKPSGTYNISLTNKKGTVLETIPMQWNGETLSLEGDEHLWKASNQIQSISLRGAEGINLLASDMQEVQEAALEFEAQMSLYMNNIISEEIRNITGSDLYNNSPFFVSIEDMNARIYEQFPHWQNGPNWEAYVTKLWEDGGKTSTRGRSEDWAYGNRRDYFSARTEELHRRENALSALLYEAVNIINQVQHGADERALLEKFENSYDNAKYKLVVGVAGINAPQRNDIFTEAMRLYQSHTQQLVERAAAQQRENNREKLRLSDPLVGGDGSSIDRTNYLESEPEVDRRLARVGRLVEYAMAQANDSRVIANIAARDDTNIQRDRYFAQQEQLVAMGNAAAKAIAERGETGETEPNDVITSVSEEIAMLGDWVTLMEQDEKLRFGAELNKFLEENGDELSTRIGNALAEAINTKQQDIPESSDLSAMFEWSDSNETYDKKSSYYVSRPLAKNVVNIFASHNFIVTNARYLGDPNATVISFGHNDSGNLGMVDYCTSNNTSASTHSSDVKAWTSLANTGSDESNRIKHVLIPADSNSVIDLAFSIMEDQDYAMFSGPFGINSNSAAHAIANYFDDISDPSWRFSPGSGNADKIKYGYYVRENGCGSGLYYGEELDSNPTF
ncbi:hypothetical protein KKF55_01050, partial [Patescibacteria group bacterium]|nr:hypothetical protein [Patescibacteria group bacterium]